MDYDKRSALKVILLSQLLNEGLDEFKDTTIYNQTIKNLSGKLEKHLEAYNREFYNYIYNDDVADATDVLDTIIDDLVHSVMLNVKSIDRSNLFILKTPNGEKRIKSNLTLEEFKMKYKIK